MRTRTVSPTSSSEKSHSLVRRLGSRKAEERLIAQDELMRMAAENPALFHADLADIIKAITGDRKRTLIVVGVILAIVHIVYIAAFILAALAQNGEIPFALGWAAAVLIPVGLAGFGISRVMLGQRRKRLAECITDIDDLNALPALIELLEFTNPTVQNTIMPPMTRLLARLRASDAHLLGYIHRTALARTLSTPRARKLPPSFFVAVLQAFEHIGDSQVLPVVIWLAEGKGVAGDHPTIQQAAQTCQTYLEELLRRHQAPYLLLRPSSAADAPHTLLRPVVSMPDSAPHELLRADNSMQAQNVSTQQQTVTVAYRPKEETVETQPIHLQGSDGP